MLSAFEKSILECAHQPYILKTLKDQRESCLPAHRPKLDWTERQCAALAQPLPLWQAPATSGSTIISYSSSCCSTRSSMRSSSSTPTPFPHIQSIIHTQVFAHHEILSRSCLAWTRSLRTEERLGPVHCSCPALDGTTRKVKQRLCKT